ncbi:MAG TPA: hypothetical protein VEA80_06380 [Vitreimonas sp.]|uniref:hypothetical protein n=1 Tax=Vitreimonas sp. TaxID=3069702 RepID=UPI002D6FDC91|nr:hypothetical protein [Vitreimonas sp.]HYD87080.1 hypothetical protein [Vitreimonas sp.]
MRLGIVAAAFALLLAGCSPPSATSDAEGPGGPQLDAPAPETTPTRAFAAANDAATAATGALNVAMALRLPDASQENADAQEVLTLTGDNGVVIEAQISGAMSPATQVEGQTLRALLEIPVEEPQVLVYRVTNETKNEGRGVCGADDAAHVIVWEPAGPGAASMKVLGVIGGAPGAAGARACPMLEYRRQ